MCAGACCLPSCAREWFGRLLAGAVQNDARDRSNNWDDLVQLPRSLPYNCVAYWCRCSLQFHQPFPMFNQKIIQEGRDLWSPQGPTPCSKQSHRWDQSRVLGTFSIWLLKPSWGWRFHSLSVQPVPVLDLWLWTFLFLYPSRYSLHLTDMHPTDFSGCPSPGNLSLLIIAWILQRAGTGVSYCSFANPLLSDTKEWAMRALSAQPSSEARPKRLKHPWRSIKWWWTKQGAGGSPGPSASVLCPIFVCLVFVPL